MALWRVIVKMKEKGGKRFAWCHDERMTYSNFPEVAFTHGGIDADEHDEQDCRTEELHRKLFFS